MKWFPAISEIGYKNNASWLNSVWIGATAPILHLPMNIFRYVLLPAIVGMLASVIGALVLFISLFIVVFAGLFGKLSVVGQKAEQ